MTAVSPIEPAYAAPPRPTPADTTFEALYEQQSSRVFGYCLKWLRSREEAEDAVQTTFLYAMRGLRRGVVPLFDEAWLLAIARNVCLSRTEVARRRAVEVARDPHVLAESVAAPATSDDLAGLSEALTGLTEPQRRAILLREWQGLSYREIADELDLSQAAVETLLFRARRALAARLRVASSFLPWLKAFAGGGAGSLAVGATIVVVTAAGSISGTGRHDRPIRQPEPATKATLHPSPMPVSRLDASRHAAPRVHAPTRSRPAAPIAPAGAVIATTAPAPLVSGVDPAPPAAQPPTAQHPTPTGSSVRRQVSDATQTVADVTQPVTEPAAGAVQAAGTVDAGAAAAVGTVETVASTAVATTTNAVATVAASASTIVPALPPLPPLTGGGLTTP